MYFLKIFQLMDQGNPKNYLLVGIEKTCFLCSVKINTKFVIPVLFLNIFNGVYQYIKPKRYFHLVGNNYMKHEELWNSFKRRKLIQFYEVIRTNIWTVKNQALQNKSETNYCRLWRLRAGKPSWFIMRPLCYFALCIS